MNQLPGARQASLGWLPRVSDFARFIKSIRRAELICQLDLPTQTYRSDQAELTKPARPIKLATFAELIGGSLLSAQVRWSGRIG